MPVCYVCHDVSYTRDYDRLFTFPEFSDIIDIMDKIIYWANLSNLSDDSMKLEPLLADLASSQSEHRGYNFLACPAITSRHKNTFISRMPYDASVRFINDELITNDDRITQRDGLYSNSYSFNWAINRIFFSPTPQLMEINPAFLHRTSYSVQGHAPSGAFDIGQWFRPSHPTFQLWPNESEFYGIKGEPHLYFNFPNDKKIKLEQFNMTDRLNDIMGDCLNYKFQDPRKKLPFIYNLFSSMGVQKDIMKEISQNLF